MNLRWWCGLAAVGLLSACAPGVAFVAQAHVQETAHRQCQQMPSMEQRNQCLQSFDKTTPKDLRPRAPMTFTAPPVEVSPEVERQRREALCIRREGQPPLCPN